MTNLEYISQQLDYAEEQLALADSMSDPVSYTHLTLPTICSV